MNAGPSGLGWCVCGTGECTCVCVGYEFCNLTVDSNLPFDAWTRFFLPEYYHGFTQKSEYLRRRSSDWKQIFKNVFMHIFILDLKMVGSKCSKSDWVFVYLLRENSAAVSCVTERPPFVTDKYSKCYWEPSYRVGISADGVEGLGQGRSRVNKAGFTVSSDLLYKPFPFLCVILASLAEFQQKEADTKAKQLEVKHELESYDGTIKENQQRIRHWKKEVIDVV